MAPPICVCIYINTEHCLFNLKKVLRLGYITIGC